MKGWVSIIFILWIQNISRNNPFSLKFKRVSDFDFRLYYLIELRNIKYPHFMDKQNSGEIGSFAQGPPSGQLPSQGPRRPPCPRPLLPPAFSPPAPGLSSARPLLSVRLPVCVLLPLPCLPQAALTSPWSCSCSVHSAVQMVPRQTESRLSRHTVSFVVGVCFPLQLDL